MTIRANERKIRGLTARVAVAALLLSAAGCKKATPRSAAASDQKTAPMPSVASSAHALGSDPNRWLAARLAHDTGASVDGGSSFAHVTYKPEVKTVSDGDLTHSFLGVSSDGHGAVFVHAPASIAGLKPGDIFMVPNEFAVKVLGIQSDQDTTTLIFDQAKLTDIVQSGQIHLDSGIRFHPPQQVAETEPAPFHWMDLLETPVYAQNGTGTPPVPGSLQPGFNTPKPGINGGSATSQAQSFMTALLSGWTVAQWDVTPGSNAASINATLTKDIGGFLAVVTMNGQVSNFQFTQDLTFPVNTTLVISGVKGMNGQMTFGWEIGKNTPGVWATEDKIRLPAGLTIPLAQFVDGLPMVLDISSALLIHPGLTGGNEYSKGNFTIGWNAGASDEGLTFQINQDQNISPVAPNAMVIAFCVPRVELQISPMGMFGSTANAKPFENIPGLNKVLGNKTVSEIGAWIDGKVASVAQSVLPANLLAAIKASPLGNFSISNILSSQADIYAQIIQTEGTTHTASITPMPCSKIELKIDGQVGGEAQLLGLTPGAKTAKTVFTKKFTRADPGSDFCKSIG
jgi:hypothetical protein